MEGTKTKGMSRGEFCIRRRVIATGELSSWAKRKPLVVLPQHRGVGVEPRALHTALLTTACLNFDPSPR
jgi:hypothetical protein